MEPIEDEYYVEFQNLMNDIKSYVNGDWWEVTTLRDKVKDGDVFISKLLGAEVVAKKTLGTGRCRRCAYQKYCMPTRYPNNENPTLIELRRLEAGHCKASSRYSNYNIYFDIVKNLYTIPEDTINLLFSLSTSDEEDSLRIQQLLLDIEYKKWEQTTT